LSYGFKGRCLLGGTVSGCDKPDIPWTSCDLCLWSPATGLDAWRHRLATAGVEGAGAGWVLPECEDQPVTRDRLQWFLPSLQPVVTVGVLPLPSFGYCGPKYAHLRTGCSASTLTACHQQSGGGNIPVWGGWKVPVTRRLGRSCRLWCARGPGSLNKNASGHSPPRHSQLCHIRVRGVVSFHPACRSLSSSPSSSTAAIPSQTVSHARQIAFG